MSKVNHDQNFDGIAQKFDNNIYGTTKGKIRHELLVDQLLQWLPEDQSLSVFDIGGGTGEMSRVMLQRGHRVLLNDISSETLAIASERLASFEHIQFLNGDLFSESSQQQVAELADCVICHAVLEWTAQPEKVVKKLAAMLKPNGILSLSFFNRDAAIFSNALYGNFDYIEKGLSVKKKVRLNPNNPQSPKTVLSWFSDLGLQVKQTAGVRCFHDYMRDRNHQTEKYQQLLALEKQLGAEEPYKWLGRYFHIIARRDG